MFKRLAPVLLILTLLSPLLLTSKAKASLQGRTTVNSQITTSHSPTVTGTIPSWCDDVAVAIGTDQQDINTLQFFFSDYNNIQLSSGSSTTNWSLNLAANSYGLINGTYYVYVSSECDYSGTYSDPLYSDVHYSVISVVPSACDALCVPVYRFYNTQNGAHFYTTNENEKRQVLNMAQFKFEGIVNYAKYYRSAISGMIPVHRFYNLRTGTHFYTANQAEASNVNATATATYRYEGIAYYTYGSQQPNTQAVHRFYKFKQGVHFFTSNQAEASNVNATQSSTYRYEGISYYNITNK